MDYVYSSHLFNEISLKFTMYYLSVNFFYIYSFLKMTSEVQRLWLCTYVEDQGCQAMNNLNEMLRSKTSPWTLFAKWLQDPANHTKVLDCNSLVLKKNWLVTANDAFPFSAILSARDIFLSSSEFDASLSDRYSLTATCQRNSLLLDSFMAFILFDTKVVPYPKARFALSKELLFRAFEASCILWRTWNSWSSCC